jgi:hypothetical protein
MTLMLIRSGRLNINHSITLVKLGSLHSLRRQIHHMFLDSWVYSRLCGLKYSSFDFRISPIGRWGLRSQCFVPIQLRSSFILCWRQALALYYRLRLFFLPLFLNSFACPLNSGWCAVESGLFGLVFVIFIFAELINSIRPQLDPLQHEQVQALKHRVELLLLLHSSQYWLHKLIQAFSRCFTSWEFLSALKCFKEFKSVMFLLLFCKLVLEFTVFNHFIFRFVS